MINSMAAHENHGSASPVHDKLEEVTKQCDKLLAALEKLRLKFEKIAHVDIDQHYCIRTAKEGMALIDAIASVKEKP